MHTPSKAWRRVFSPSRIFAHTLIESPGRNSGRVAGRRWLLSIESRIRWALMTGNPAKSRWDAGFYGRSPPRVKVRDPRGDQRVGREAPLRPSGPKGDSS